MSTDMNQKQTPTSNVAILQEPTSESKGYWADAWSRLARNRLAVVGLLIIMLNILLAVFAPFVTSYSYTEQNRDAADAAPAWVMRIFPTLKPRDESWRIRDGEPQVVTGQQVKAGDVLATNIGRDGEVLYANMDGIVFVDSSRIELTALEVPVFEIPAGTELHTGADVPVKAGDLLFNEVTSPIDGIVFLTDSMLYVRPNNVGGYTPLRNEYLLGTDNLGRDLWARMVYGARVSLLVALIGPVVSLLIGLPYGLISGYFGGRIDNWMMRFVDLMYAFPTLLLIILLMAFFRSSTTVTTEGSFVYKMAQIDRASGGMFFIFLGVGITAWMGLARLTRGQVLYVREMEYVLAARSVGSNTRSILWKHILPNILGPIIISETLSIPTYISYEAFLSFIGLGVNPPTPSWGIMISDGARVLRSAPHEAIFPALALFFIMFAFNFLGDGLRDALDPRLRGSD
jgi:oligopeptide transport system permease protein